MARASAATRSQLLNLRRELHRYPELSGQEAGTAERIARYFSALAPDQALVGLAETGLAFVFSGAGPGPTILLRCELDALPISEPSNVPHRSRNDGVSHKCGHDGHMAILAAVGSALCRSRPSRGRVVLLYQPAEETGQGAAAVLADSRFDEMAPDYCFALHNLPGIPLGEVVIRSGTFCCASRGVVVTFRGQSAHAAQPETGLSPTGAMTALIEELNHLHRHLDLGGELAFATVVGARLGDRAFGVAPADAEVMATLRSESDDAMDRMIDYVCGVAGRLASKDGLALTIEWEDIFPATVNTQRGVELVTQAAKRCQRPIRIGKQPFRWSEDFGRYPARRERAMFGLGAGERTAPLHDPHYDFPEELIEVGATLFCHVIDECLMNNPSFP